ncbi:TolC family protein [Paenibacillus sp. M1]|uniref:TolC family protein n=1 Tax=Paenibacillus haidiansis TaxID=1574488 RepID=A0ABU7VU55_9BACL
MKRKLAAFTLSLALLAGGPVSAFAADSDNTTKSGNAASTDKDLRSSFVESGNLISIKHLDLDTVLDLALNNSYNLSLLEMKLTALRQNEDNLEEQGEQLEGAGIPNISGSLPGTLEEFLEEYGLSIDDETTELPDWLEPAFESGSGMVNGIVQGYNGIASMLNQQIQSSREQLELGLDQIGVEKSNTLIDLEKARTGAKLQITSQYVQLLSLDKQIELGEKYLGVLNGDYNRAVVMQREAMATNEDVTAAQRLVDDQQEQLDTLRDNYQLALIQMCYDLGLVYDPEIMLRDIPYTPESITRKDTEDLLENSYDMKQKWNAIVLANKQEKHTSAANEHEEDYLDTMTRIAEEQAEQTRVELSKKISKTYSDANTAYKAYQNAAKDLTEVQQDYANMEVRFENGLVSRYDFNKYGFRLTQQELALDLTRLQTYMAAQAVEAMEEGLIN